MKKTTRFLIIAGALVCASLPCRAGMEEGETAFKNGDFAKAILELEPLALSGNPTAQSMLGVIYADGLGGTSKDMSKALDLFRKAAEQGEPSGAYSLGVAMLKGDGLSANFPEAAKLFEKAMEKGHPCSGYVLARMQISGNGIPQSVESGMSNMNTARRANCKEAARFQSELLAHFGKEMKIVFEGGFGDDKKSAVRIKGPSNSLQGIPFEYKYLAIVYPGWQKSRQELLRENGKILDALGIKDSKGNMRTVYFDITEWYGMPQQ